MSNYCQLSQDERYTISGTLRSYASQAELAKAMGRHPSTISRELKRNRRPSGCYTAPVAQSYAVARRHRSRRGSQFTEDQWSIVISLLKRKWSPEQIVDHLVRHHDFTMSHETIYKFVLADKKRGGTLYTNLRIMPKIRRKRYNTRDSRGILPGKRHISTRPAEVESRSVLGHWEGDTVMGNDKRNCILTLVERKTGLVIIKKLCTRTVLETTNAAMMAILQNHGKFKTITFDNGTEFHGYKVLEQHYPVTCYFATPYHSWERGTNENTNGLIRQYLPKGTSMRRLTQEHCDWIAEEINTRPRKRHGYKTPKELYYDQ